MRLRLHGLVCGPKPSPATCGVWTAAAEADPSHPEDVSDFLSAAILWGALQVALAEEHQVLYAYVGRRAGVEEPEPSSIDARARMFIDMASWEDQKFWWQLSSAVATPYGIGLGAAPRSMRAKHAADEVRDMLSDRVILRTIADGGFLGVALAPHGLPHDDAATATALWTEGDEGHEV